MEKWQEEAVKKSLSKFNVVKGKNLPKQIYQEKRDCYSDLADYVTSTDLKFVHCMDLEEPVKQL